MWYQVICRNIDEKGKSYQTSATCYAESRDALKWGKPVLGQVNYKNDEKRNNMLLENGAQPSVVELEGGKKHSLF